MLATEESILECDLESESELDIVPLAELCPSPHLLYALFLLLLFTDKFRILDPSPYFLLIDDVVEG